MSEIRLNIIKYSCLSFLVVHNSAYFLTLRYSRTLPGDRYITSTAVFLTECQKCVVSIIMYTCLRLSQHISRSGRQQASKETIPLVDDESGISLNSNTKKWYSPILISKEGFLNFIPILVPAVLYTITNNLQFIALSNMEATTFQVLYQGRLLTTAVCAVIFLDKHLTRMQAGCIFVLTLGVAAASVPSKQSSSATVPQNHAVGIAAVSIACILSGFAGVYTEKILKRTQTPRTEADDASASASTNNDDGETSKFAMFWLRNFQLSLGSIFFAACACFIADRQVLSKEGFFFGYNKIVWTVITLQAIGGLTVSLVITYADNILKGFATSLSVVLSAIISYFLWNIAITPLFLVGMLAVISATCLYGWAGRENAEKSPAVLYTPVATDEVQEMSELPQYTDKNDAESSDTEDSHLEDDHSEESHLEDSQMERTK